MLTRPEGRSLAYQNTCSILASVVPSDSTLPSSDPTTLARDINARFNTRVVQVGAETVPRNQGVSTGFPALDTATGWGGFPRGHVTELIGLPTSGCTSVALRAVAAGGGYAEIGRAHV